MRDVALLGINPGMCTAFLDRGRGVLACAACPGNLSASALTILGEAQLQKNITKNTMRCMDGPKAIIIIMTFAPPSVGPRGSTMHGMAWPWLKGNGKRQALTNQTPAKNGEIRRKPEPELGSAGWQEFLFHH